MSMNNFLLQLVQWFLTRQLHKWGAALDWEKVKRDFDVRIKALVPGTAWDDTSCYIVNVLIDLVAYYFQNPDFAASLGNPPKETILNASLQRANTDLPRKLAEAAMAKSPLKAV